MQRVTIVITTCNGYAFTRTCIESITFTVPADLYDLVIVDNGSSDETLGLKSWGRTRFLSNELPSLYESWNVGVDAADTDVVVVLNNDVLFMHKGWLEALVRGIGEGGLAWSFPVLLEDQAPFFDAYDRVRSCEQRAGLDIEQVPGTIEAACFAIERALLDDVGPFDSQFEVWYGEKDYEVRLLEAGRPYGRVKNAAVRHFGASTIRVGLDDQRRAFEMLPPPASSVDERARRDYERFKAKYEPKDLEALGLRMPGFGPIPLRPTS